MLPWLSRQISDVVSLLFYTMNNVKFNPHLQYIALISSFCLWHLLYLIFSVVNSTGQLLNGVNVNYYRLFCWFCILMWQHTGFNLFFFVLFGKPWEGQFPFYNFIISYSSYYILLQPCTCLHSHTQPWKDLTFTANFSLVRQKPVAEGWKSFWDRPVDGARYGAARRS